MPTGLEKFFFATSGTEANEAAMKIARLYTGKSKIISRYRSYHGSTAASISVSGDPRRIPTEPTGKMPGGLFGPDAYCYRCPFGLEYPECDIACAEYLDYMIKHESDIAAVIVEPIVGSNGVIVPPDEYLPRIREITENYGVLLICDEVMTAWGRTGKWFAVDHWKLNPDIITTAKGITGAYVPLSVTATTKEIADHFEDNYFAHGHTYEAHPLTLAAGVAAISEYRRLNLVERSEKVGKALGNKLKAVQDRHPSVGDVRGIGMFWGIELVQDRKSKHATNTVEEKLNGKPLIVDLVASDCMRQGVFVMTGFTNCLIIAPPLVVEEKDLDKGITALDQSLRIADEAVEHGQ
jgi:taurine--2-oxoglutarate transaminase